MEVIKTAVVIEGSYRRLPQHDPFGNVRGLIDAAQKFGRSMAELAVIAHAMTYALNPEGIMWGDRVPEEDDA